MNIFFLILGLVTSEASYELIKIPICYGIKDITLVSRNLNKSKKFAKNLSLKFNDKIKFSNHQIFQNKNIDMISIASHDNYHFSQILLALKNKKHVFVEKPLCQTYQELEKIKQELNKKDQDKKKQAKLIQDKIKNKEYEIKKLSTENKELYGSVKPTEISKILEEQDKVVVNPSLIQPIKEIKSLGNFKVSINLHSEVQTQIVIKVIPQEEIK